MATHLHLGRAFLPALLLGLVSTAAAQQGSLDQVGTYSGGVFTPDGWILQQQVRAGRSGLLEGVEVVIGSAPIGATFALDLRRGPGPSTAPSLFSALGTVTMAPGVAEEAIYFDVSAASIQLAAGEEFVIELRSINQISSTLDYAFAKGVDPYPEPFFLNGQPWPGGGGYSLAFRTWMDGGVGLRYCSTAPNSHSVAGAVLSVHGSTSVAANDLVMIAARVPGDPGLFYLGTSQTQLPFGNGFRCVAGKVSRMPVAQGQHLLLTQAVGLGPGGMPQLLPGTTWNFQAWFRDPAAGLAGFNLSDAVQLSFTP